eukprot:TRINITY_DN2727_c0_g1_i1.p2 TRINITY_DN2727_c0_g1~~TRINITY_DN2727_c0_g1_i1.p2  ORF type:complete len:236 (-),score=37.94 TRINITY_DN2727_c0_g1_i1:464-1171(-)
MTFDGVSTLSLTQLGDMTGGGFKINVIASGNYFPTTSESSSPSATLTASKTYSVTPTVSISSSVGSAITGSHTKSPSKTQQTQQTLSRTLPYRTNPHRTTPHSEQLTVANDNHMFECVFHQRSNNKELYCTLSNRNTDAADLVIQLMKIREIRDADESPVRSYFVFDHPSEVTKKDNSLMFSTKLPNGAVIISTFEFNSKTRKKSFYNDAVNLLKGYIKWTFEVKDWKCYVGNSS